MKNLKTKIEEYVNNTEEKGKKLNTLTSIGMLVEIIIGFTDRTIENLLGEKKNDN